ncbi:uncharacterized protein DUF4037 [Paenibacillus taihuensis]|uniref:Uncharacterized protein DUF4037 n=1 Tax=Paenibacillus taihuensis TaxID=1156355 RepID=A0A3D9S9L5_9BACL|nr:DUF4037 domain-containing protein [Paenibacillus taihuensis]REE86130.1 uncharacterized protein DUF4037 [Paenibacillus taihuensis]
MQGIELSRRFYNEIIEPIISEYSASNDYAAALIGPGSEVLGFDTEMSQDHDWGPRVCLFLGASYPADAAEELRARLEKQAPEGFYGFPVDTGMTLMTTVEDYVGRRLGLGVNTEIGLLDWLTFPSQTLLELTSGAVFKDGAGQLMELRRKFAYYPDDVWLYLIFCTWQRIGQEEHLMNRAGSAGDELGSAVIGSRMVRDVMNLCFLMERRYAPYPKWFGTAFKQLNCAEQVLPLLLDAQTATSWRTREGAFNRVYRILARMHNDLGLTETPASEEAAPFFTRPFNVMNGGDIAALLAPRIKDREIRWLAENRPIGSIDQITDNTDVRNMPQSSVTRARLKKLYRRI